MCLCGLPQREETEADFWTSVTSYSGTALYPQNWYSRNDKKVQRLSLCVCVCMWCYCMCVAIQREIEGRTQEEHNNLGQCSLHQSLPQRHWQATRLQLSVKVSFILTSAQLAYKITTPIVVWWFICHENRLVEWVLVCEGGWLKWEVGSYVTGSEVRWREGGTSGCGVHFPLFPVFCFVSAR